MTDQGNFQEFKFKYRHGVNYPRINLLRRGYFSINRAAYDLLGQPSYVILLYNKGARLIGLRPSDGKEVHSYKVSRLGSSSNWVVAAVAFCRCHDIMLDTVRNFTLGKEDEIFVLREEGRDE